MGTLNCPSVLMGWVITVSLLSCLFRGKPNVVASDSCRVNGIGALITPSTASSPFTSYKHIEMEE